MPYDIAISNDALAQLRRMPIREQRVIEAAVAARLLHQPTSPTRAVKRLRPNPCANFELRVGDLRILYKDGSSLIVDGKVFDEHQDPNT